MAAAHTVVIGLGNQFRGDDAVGLTVAETIYDLALPGVRVIAGVSDGASLIAHWEGATLSYVVDCTVSGAPAGTVRRFDIGRDMIPERLFSSFSTHAFSVSQAIELARQVDRLPQRLVVFGIEGSRFETGGRVSEAVRAGAEEIVKQIAADLSRSAPTATLQE